MVVSIQGRHMYLSRAVDSEGEVVDILVQQRRDKAAALRRMRKLLKKQGCAARVLVTNKLRSYVDRLRTLTPLSSELNLCCGWQIRDHGGVTIGAGSDPT